MIKHHPFRISAIAVIVGGFAVQGTALAQSTEDLKRQIDDMQRQLQQLRQQLDAVQRKQEQAPPPPPPRAAPGAPMAAAPAGAEFLARKPGDGVTFYTRGGEVSVYGHFDLSLDTATKGIADLTDSAGNHPPGRLGWQPAISSNLSYVGVRGFQTLPAEYRFVYQLETQVDVSVTPGASQSNSNTSGQVKGALASRNSYIGIASDWGALKIGKTDAPYKNSTARMNEFSGMVGDYGAI
ncbi:MAG: porin, partial [Bacillota bacterium]